MTCNVCGVNEATVHLTEIVNNQMIEVHLCETCAQEKGTDFKTHFSIDDLLAGLTDITKQIKQGEKKASSLCCSGCGMTYEEFGKSGRLGCATCYEAFSKMLLPLIKRIQRSTHHVGKKPSKIPRATRSVHDLRVLQDRLRKSVQTESFEDAAKIRDEIKQIEEKLKKGKKKNNE
ncbi:MAG: UvrB/UvrC motif-containing protein [Candidatus Omnitrophica bacterium]|nr:UvrB/UvrC motif-containing protein [Candidatus Omnitrophota bacterium]